MTGLTCDADVATVLMLLKARRVALTAIGRTLEGKPYDAEEIKEEVGADHEASQAVDVLL